MSKSWIPWSDRNDAFAPVLGLHRLDPFYPTTIEAMIKKQCELMVLRLHGALGTPGAFGRVTLFSDKKTTTQQKIQLLLHKEFNKKITYLDLHGHKIDIKASAKLQKKQPKQVYVRGFRHKKNGDAYIVYRFFYLENFVPGTGKQKKIKKKLKTNPEDWWSHEGDWEGISIYFKDHQRKPTKVFFSQHLGAESRKWAEVVKKRTRVQALPALGTHATYNKRVSKRLKPSIDPFLDYYDIAEPHRFYYPQSIAKSGEESYRLVELDPKKKHLWLHYKGHWGATRSHVEQAPRGPLFDTRKHFALLCDRK